MSRALLVVTLLAGCAGPTTFLGARLPDTCRGANVEADSASERCVGWILDRVGVVAPDDEYDDPALRDYVAGVANRVARANHLREPIVRIVDRAQSPAFARPGGYLYVSRDLLAILADESELAAVMAHELAHDHAGHVADILGTYAAIDDGLAHERTRDDEAAADELAVTYTIAAGYRPDALRTALIALDRAVLSADAVSDGASADAAPPTPPVPEPDAVSSADGMPPPPIDPNFDAHVDDRHKFPRWIDDSDLDHPSLPERLARVALMVAGRTGGDSAAERYRAHVAGVVFGPDPRRGVLTNHDTLWTNARLGLAVNLPADPQVAINLRGIGKSWGDAVADALSVRRHRRIAGHPAVVGIVRELSDDRRSELRTAMDAPRPTAGSAIAVITLGARAVVISVEGANAERELAGILATARAMTADEIAAVKPNRLAFVAAPHAGTVGELQTELCGKVALSHELDDQSRRVPVGDAVKCVEN